MSNIKLETVTMESGDTKIKVTTPYNKDFVDICRKLNGRFNRKTKSWYFDVDLETEILNVLNDIFGYGSEKVNIELIIFCNNVSWGHDEMYFVGKQLFSRKYRDYKVTIHPDASLLDGEFKTSGGSARHPLISTPITETLKLKIRNVPKNLLHELDNKDAYQYTIIEDTVKSKYSDYSFEQLIDIMKEVEKELHKRMENVKSKVMTLAWKYYKSEKYNTFSESLKNAWKECKTNA